MQKENSKYNKWRIAIILNTIVSVILFFVSFLIIYHTETNKPDGDKNSPIIVFVGVLVFASCTKTISLVMDFHISGHVARFPDILIRILVFVLEAIVLVLVIIIEVRESDSIHFLKLVYFAPIITEVANIILRIVYISKGGRKLNK